MKTSNRILAEQFCKAIKTISEKLENLENLESYLSQHFSVWIEKFARTPEDLTFEMTSFAEMEF